MPPFSVPFLFWEFSFFFTLLAVCQFIFTPSTQWIIHTRQGSQCRNTKNFHCAKQRLWLGCCTATSEVVLPGNCFIQLLVALFWMFAVGRGVYFIFVFYSNLLLRIRIRATSLDFEFRFKILWKKKVTTTKLKIHGRSWCTKIYISLIKSELCEWSQMSKNWRVNWIYNGLIQLLTASPWY